MLLRGRRLIALVAASLALLVWTGCSDRGEISQGRDDQQHMWVAPSTAATESVSAYPGEMGEDALAAIRDPANKGKWIGMVMGEDGKLHVDQVVDAVPTPAEQAARAKGDK